VNLELIIFGGMFVVALGSSLAMLFARNAVHTALFLVLTQLALALSFLLQGAFFIAAIQIILYAGAIMVLFLFVIMLLGVDRREALIDPLPGQRVFAVGLGALLATQMLWIAFRGLDVVAAGNDNTSGIAELNRDPGNVQALAGSLFGKYSFAFEATSVLLVAAIIGAMVLARRIGALSIAPSEEESEARLEIAQRGDRGPSSASEARDHEGDVA
jgi:NADH-quinone oxidoreductase subunit J